MHPGNETRVARHRHAHPSLRNRCGRRASLSGNDKRLLAVCSLPAGRALAELGSSEDGLGAARVEAALGGRDYVIPEDVSALAGIVLAHRILPTVEAQVARRNPESIIASALGAIPIPERR